MSEWGSVSSSAIALTFAIPDFGKARSLADPFVFDVERSRGRRDDSSAWASTLGMLFGDADLACVLVAEHLAGRLSGCNSVADAIAVVYQNIDDSFAATLENKAGVINTAETAIAFGATDVTATGYDNIPARFCRPFTRLLAARSEKSEWERVSNGYTKGLKDELTTLIAEAFGVKKDELTDPIVELASSALRGRKPGIKTMYEQIYAMEYSASRDGKPNLLPAFQRVLHHLSSGKRCAPHAPRRATPSESQRELLATRKETLRHLWDNVDRASRGTTHSEDIRSEAIVVVGRSAK